MKRGVWQAGGFLVEIPLLSLSADLAAIFMPAGPMLAGRWRDQRLGSGTDVWKFWA